MLKHNGKTDASSSAVDNFAQLMLGHLPLLLHPEARDVLNIGLGGGITLSAIAAHPQVARITQVEIDPLVVEAAREWFGGTNRQALDDPRVRLAVDDGRNFVERTPERYDVIISEPPNLWVSGVSGLFTEEFYRAARGRLKPGGLLCQWLPLYELTADDFAVALRTLGGVFPHLRVWTNGSVALVLAGESAPGAAPGGPYPPLAVADLERVGIPAERVAAYLAAPDLAEARIASIVSSAADRNRDDRPLLEFRCARSLFLQNKDPRAAQWRSGLAITR
jgi:spermidine synthase